MAHLCSLLLGAAAAFPATTPRVSPVWPEPKAWAAGSGALPLSPAVHVEWELGGGGAAGSGDHHHQAPAALDKAFARFRAAAFPHRVEEVDPAALARLVVAVRDSAADLQLGANESYTLDVPSVEGSPSSSAAAIRLTADTQLGVFRGLETLAQLVAFDFDSLSYAAHGTPIHIDDAPRFPQ